MDKTKTDCLHNLLVQSGRSQVLICKSCSSILINDKNSNSNVISLVNIRLSY